MQKINPSPEFYNLLNVFPSFVEMETFKPRIFENFFVPDIL